MEEEETNEEESEDESTEEESEEEIEKDLGIGSLKLGTGGNPEQTARTKDLEESVSKEFIEKEKEIELPEEEVASVYEERKDSLEGIYGKDDEEERKGPYGESSGNLYEEASAGYGTQEAYADSGKRSSQISTNAKIEDSNTRRLGKSNLEIVGLGTARGSVDPMMKKSAKDHDGKYN